MSFQGARSFVHALRMRGKSRATDVLMFSGTGAPSGGGLPTGQVMDAAQAAVYFRRDGTINTAMYGTVNGGTNWTVFDPAALSGFDLNGTELVLDADADTSITADTDDQIDIRISGADDFRFVANIFRALSGSTIETNTLNETTAGSGVTIDGLLIKDGGVVSTAASGWTHSTAGDLTFDNQLVTGSTIFALGTDTTATSFEVQNDSAAVLFSVTPSSATAGTALVAGALDLNGTLDQDAALTGTGDGANIAVTMSHASQSAEALDVSIAQITNGRTSGDLVAIKASITSLTGSTAGVDHVAYDGVCTAGDADSDHILVRQGANFSHTLDLRGIATGEGIVAVKDNLASAFEIKEGSNSILKVVTTDGSESVQVRGLQPVSSSAAAITEARTLTAADSGGVFSVAKTSAYEITLPTPAQGLRFKFLILDTGAFAVTFTDGAAHLMGAVNVNNTLVAMTGTTITSASGASVGDWLEFEGIDATHYLVTGACIAAADITVA